MPPQPAFSWRSIASSYQMKSRQCSLGTGSFVTPKRHGRMPRLRSLWLLSAVGFLFFLRPAFGFLCRKETVSKSKRWISSGLTFEDGDQILVSVQKPLGVILEQDSDSVIRIADIDPTGSGAASGLRVGDILLAVQNADMIDRDLEYAMKFIYRSPKVVNLRFARMPSD